MNDSVNQHSAAMVELSKAFLHSRITGTTLVGAGMGIELHS